jgi:hypothetical protein
LDVGQGVSGAGGGVGLVGLKKRTKKGRGFLIGCTSLCVTHMNILGSLLLGHLCNPVSVGQIVYISAYSPLRTLLVHCG